LREHEGQGCAGGLERPNREVVHRDLVAVAADKQAGVARGELIVGADDDHLAIDGQTQAIAAGPSDQLVGGYARLDRIRLLPGQQVDPTIAVAPPDAHLAGVADLDYVVAPLLSGPVLRLRRLIAQDDAVAAARWAAEFVEGAADDNVA